MKTKTLFALIAAITLFCSGCFLYTNDDDPEKKKFKSIKTGRIYILTAADGSGRVPVYAERGTEPQKYVPDGTEARTGRHRVGSRINTTIDGEIGLYVNYFDFKEETSESIAKRIAERSRTIRIFFAFVLWLVLILMGFVIIFFISKKLAQSQYFAYYSGKSKEFPWLKSYIQKNGNPSVLRSEGNEYPPALLGWIIYIIAIIVYIYVADKLYPGSMRLYGSDPVKESFLYLIMFLSVMIPLAVSMLSSLTLLLYNPDKLMERESPSYQFPTDDLTFKCPSCGCPHAWGIKLREVLNLKSKTTSQDMRETTWKEKDGIKVYGSEETRDYTVTTTTYWGDVIEDYECENCGHTKHNEYSKTWVNYSPPLRQTGLKAYTGGSGGSKVGGIFDILSSSVKITKKILKGIGSIFKIIILIPLALVLEFPVVIIFFTWPVLGGGVAALAYALEKEIFSKITSPLNPEVFPQSFIDFIGPSTGFPSFVMICIALVLVVYTLVVLLVNCKNNSRFTTISLLIILFFAVFGYISLIRNFMDIKPILPDFVYWLTENMATPVINGE
uniref:Uncharacterized protein n=1 Tax=uncultured bacterium contig00037 TaxID=1181525 RepID=A0A806JY29_9BACT|nr:hypothetical protein [uncultured bacterium contig00037]